MKTRQLVLRVAQVFAANAALCSLGIEAAFALSGGSVSAFAVCLLAACNIVMVPQVHTKCDIENLLIDSHVPAKIGKKLSIGNAYFTVKVFIQPYITVFAPGMLLRCALLPVCEPVYVAPQRITIISK